MRPRIKDKLLGKAMQIAAFTTVKNKQSIKLIIADSLVQVATSAIGFSYGFIIAYNFCRQTKAVF
ncbi:hypothetical protein UH38_09040 [Aliterella atlantica CENA595]|uniref:Uncharacterized protein n=1 Tax=Aliterella atlantica CENA595 TaxID=1618023 RepID=A0A0D8ZYC1_9CYAN|nr:hypothetical protein UH38_09040 [Aliterella atlantica CENA595]